MLVVQRPAVGHLPKYKVHAMDEDPALSRPPKPATGANQIRRSKQRVLDFICKGDAFFLSFRAVL